MAGPFKPGAAEAEAPVSMHALVGSDERLSMGTIQIARTADWWEKTGAGWQIGRPEVVDKARLVHGAFDEYLTDLAGS